MAEFDTQAYNRTALYAAAMLAEIKTELADVAYVTREDLLHLPCFSALATITRYRYVCLAVQYAIDRKWMLSMSRTELILTGAKKAYTNSVRGREEYYESVLKLLPPRGTVFTVSTVLARWEADHHLTTNAKRTVVRECIRHFLRTEQIVSVDFNLYERR